MYRVKDIFTVRDGKWEVDNRPYGLTKEYLDKYGADAPHLGGATHIFAKTIGGPSNRFLFFTRDHGHEVPGEEKENGWANHNIEHGSGFVPERGETGWWNVQVKDAPSEIVEGIGLPNSEHISTFVVFEWVEDGELPDDDGPEIPEEPTDPTQPTTDEIIIEVKITKNGTYIGGYTKVFHV